MPALHGSIAPMDDNGYITLDEAQDILRVSVRQVHNHIAGGKLRSKKEGRRRLVLQEDALKLAEELHSSERQPAQPAVEVIEAIGPFLEHIRELTAELAKKAEENGKLRAELEYLTAILHQQEAEHTPPVLAPPPPWWKRLLGG